MAEYDVVVIGAGVVGCATAMYLSQYDLNVLVIERCEDVCSGSSKANSGIVHAGYDALPGTLKARFNVRGAELIRELSKKLDFPFRENGSMVVSFDPDKKDALLKLYERGIKNGVKDLSIISGDEARKIEKNLSPKISDALLVPHGGIVCPFLMTVAFAENAAVNGVAFSFLTEVKNVERKDEGYNISVLRKCKEKGGRYTDKEEIIKTKAVINAAGLYSDKVNNMVSEKKLHITARRGEYELLDRSVGDLTSHTIFQLPTEKGKGVLVTPTAHGNLMVGPSAQEIDDKEDNSTTEEFLTYVRDSALNSIPDIPYAKTITSFAGLRASEDNRDFVIGMAEDAKGFFNAAGIESPGLSAAPAIGEYLAKEVSSYIGAAENDAYIDIRAGFINMKELSVEDKNKMIKARPDYGVIVCRCEEITEGQIRDAIKRPVGAVSMDGIKRRVRQGMGRCQGGFCTPRVMEILAEELGIDIKDVCKNMPGSNLLGGDR